MKTGNLNYLDHLELLTVLIGHLGTQPQDDATAEELAEHLGFSEKEVIPVLDEFKAIFRKSRKPKPSRGHQGEYHRYSLLRRYAKRIYENGELVRRSEPLSETDISSLLNYVENRVKFELEDRRNRIEILVTMGAAIVAALASIIAAFLQ